MIDWTSNLCPCGSGLETAHCCIPTIAPLVDRANRWENLELKLGGTDDAGLPVSIARALPELEAVATVRQPHHIDAKIERICFSIALALEEELRENNEVDAWLTRVYTGLHAFRYHQRQFLHRLKAVREAHVDTKIKGSTQLKVRMEDFPCRFELEGMLIRVRACLDAASGLLGVSIGKGKRKFGKICQWANAGNVLPNSKEYRKVIKANQVWMDLLREIRDEVVHEGSFEDLTDIEFGVEAIDWHRVGDHDADDLAVLLWQRVPAFVYQVATTAHVAS